MTPAEQVAAVETFLAHVNRGELEEAAQLLHPDYYVREQPGLPYAGEWRGRAGFLGLMSAAGQTWSRWRDSPYPYELAVDGDRVIKEVRFTATARASGREVEMDMAEVFVFEDDLIARTRAYYWDPETLRAATTP